MSTLNVETVIAETLKANVVRFGSSSANAPSTNLAVTSMVAGNVVVGNEFKSNTVNVQVLNDGVANLSGKWVKIFSTQISNNNVRTVNIYTGNTYISLRVYAMNVSTNSANTLIYSRVGIKDQDSANSQATYTESTVYWQFGSNTFSDIESLTETAVFLAFNPGTHGANNHVTGNTSRGGGDFIVHYHNLNTPNIGVLGLVHSVYPNGTTVDPYVNQFRSSFYRPPSNPTDTVDRIQIGTSRLQDMFSNGSIFIAEGYVP